MPTIYLRDIDGTGSMHVCAKDDEGAIEYAQINKDLHAAAPDLLSALEIMLNAVVTHGMWRDHGDAIKDIARRAIKKARGEI